MLAWLSWQKRAPSRTALLGIALTVLLAFLAYAWTLDDYLTGRDLPGLLYAFKSLDPISIFSVGQPVGAFYRPLAALSYSLTYQLFGLNAVPYHLTDLLLHVTVALLTFAFTRILFPNKNSYAILAGAIVALHPAAVEVVPNISHHMDSLVTVFVLLTLIFIARAQRAAPTSRASIGQPIYYLLSIVAVIFAILSKEIGFLTPVLIAWYVLLRGAAVTWRQRAACAILTSLPLTIPTAALWWWRARVLGTTFGSNLNSPLTDPVSWTKNTLSNLVTYFWFLLFPQSPSTTAFDQNQFANFLNANRLELALVFILTLAALITFFSTHRHSTVLAHFLSPSTDDRTVLFLFGWLVFPFAVYALTLFSYRYIYFSIPPFAILLAFILLRLVEHARTAVHSYQSPRAFCFLLTSAGILAGVLLLAQLLCLSPLLHSYNQFEKNGITTRGLLDHFQTHAAELQAAKTITVENLPDLKPRASFTAPQPKELAGIWLPAYYRLLTGDTADKWCVTSVVKTVTADTSFTAQSFPNGEYRITFQPQPDAPRVEYPTCCPEFYCK